MPIYEYECNSCGKQHEFIQKFSESPKRKCPSCGKTRLRRMVSAAAFHLKGNGWYVTDFKDQNKSDKKGESATDAKADGKADKDKAAASKDSKDTKSSGKDKGKSSPPKGGSAKNKSSSSQANA